MEKVERPGTEKYLDEKPEIIKDSYTGSGKLKGKNALITGGDSGIGRAVAVHYAKEGCNVLISYLEEHEDAEDTKKLVEQQGVTCSYMAGDLREESYRKELLEQFKEQYGKLDILVNNAATQYSETSFEDISDDHIKETFDTNIVAMIILTKAAMPLMSSGSRIINTTSVTAYEGNQLLVDYSSTKGAIVSFTRALSGQLAERNILVNGVAPGPIWTPLIPATLPEEKVKKFGENTPLGRKGQPSEVAPAYVYLASEDSTYMTGQILHINGGRVVGG